MKKTAIILIAVVTIGIAISIYFLKDSQYLLAGFETEPKEGLVGWWTMDGRDVIWTSSSTASTIDRSGNGNNGTLTNMNKSTSPVMGKIGQALKFDGADDYVNVGDITFLDDLTSMSFSFWIYPTNVTGVHGIMGKFLSSNGPVIWSNNKTLYWQIGANPANNLAIENALTPNTWTHIVALENNGIMTVYKNGILQSGIANAGTNTNNAATLKIGLNNDGNVGRMNGKLDDVRIYNRNLSSSEIKTLYREGLKKRSSIGF